MASRGRPTKPLYERTMPVAVKAKYIAWAQESGLTINQLLESQERTIEHLKANIKGLQRQIQKLVEELEKYKSDGMEF